MGDAEMAIGFVVAVGGGRCGRTQAVDRVRQFGCGRKRCAPRVAALESAESGEQSLQRQFDANIPPLYDGWFSQSGVITTQMQEAARHAVDSGDRLLEISFPPVPNVDEVKFGTKLNSMFAEDMARYFDMVDDVRKVKRYMIEFANTYWAARLAEAFPERSAWILYCNSVKKDDARMPPNVQRLCPLNRVERGAEPSDSELIIVADPGPTENWRKGATFQGKDRVVVMLNSGFVETYDLCGPLKEFKQVYFLKRVSKGWVYRSTPQPWITYLEKPNGDVEVMDVQDKRPSLNQASKQLRTESFRRYSIYNDRWSPGFGARL